MSERDSLCLDSIEAALTDSLKQVEVTASNIVHLKDKDVIYITREMRKGSYDTGELLGRIPGMSYNKVTKGLRYKGKSNILLLVDSIEWDENYVKALHHIRFDKIEVISNPSGKYGSYDVLINLCRKENYQGYENSGNAFAYFSPGGRIVQNSLLSSWDGNDAITYTHNKWNFFARYYTKFDHDEQDNTSASQYLLNDYMEEVIKNPDGKKNYCSIQREHNLTASLDYQFDKQNSVSLSYALGYSNNDGQSPQTIVRSDLDGNVQDTIGSLSQSGAAGYRHTLAAFFRGGHGVWHYSADMNYVLSNTDSQYRLEKTSGYLNIDNRHNNMNHTLARAELNRHFLQDKLYLAVGYNNLWKHYIQSRAVTKETLTDYTLWQNTSWANISYDITGKTTMSLSGSVTTNHTVCDQTSDRYLSWSGGAWIYQEMKNKNWLRFDYTCNISNPDINQVTSYGQFTDSLTWTGGNPLLHSSATHWLKLQYGFLDDCITIAPEYTFQPRTFTNITTLRYGTLQNGEQGSYAATMPQNAVWHRFELGIYFYKEIKDFSLDSQAFYTYERGKYTEDGNTFRHGIGGWAFNFMITYNIRKWDAYAVLAYNNDTYSGAWAQGRNHINAELYYAQIGKSFLHERIKLELFYCSPLHIASSNNTSVWETPAIVAHYNKYNMNKRWDNRFSITFSYRLYGGKSIREYNRELSEEK